MKMGSVCIRTLNDGGFSYRADMTRDKKTYRATFKTEEEARKWLKKIHNKCLENKVKDTMNDGNVKEKKEKDYTLNNEAGSDFNVLIDSINYVLQEQLELQHKVDKLFNLFRSI